MAGALTTMMTRHRRRFADGGVTTGEPVPGALAMAPLDMSPDQAPAPQQGILSSGTRKPAGSPALSSPSAADRAAAIKKAQIDQATSILAAGGARPQSYMPPVAMPPDPTMTSPGYQTFQGNGWSNLPQLAAAGAMLAPTRTGGFSESLGNAFSAGSQEAMKQRELIENAALRAQQQEYLANYHQQIADARTQDANTRAGRLDADLPLIQAKAALAAASAAQRGADKVTEAELIQSAARSLVGSVNPDGSPALGPDGKPWTQLTALQAARTTAGQQQNANTNETRADNSYQMGMKRIDLLQKKLDVETDAKKAAEIRDDIKAQIDLLTKTKDASGNLTMTPTQAGATFKQLKTGVPPIAPDTRQFPTPPQAAIDMLKSKPDTAHLFEQTFGPGSAQRALGQ